MPPLPPDPGGTHLPEPLHAKSLQGCTARSATPGDGRDYRDLGAGRGRGVETLGEPHVLLGDVDVDEPAQLALLVDDPRLDAREGALERLDDLVEGRALSGDLRLVLRVRAKDRRDSYVDAHSAPWMFFDSGDAGGHEGLIGRRDGGRRADQVGDRVEGLEAVPGVD